jgi:hypothetical protein
MERFSEPMSISKTSRRFYVHQTPVAINMSFPAALRDIVSPRFCRLDFHLEVVHENTEGASVECTSLSVVVFS